MVMPMLTFKTQGKLNEFALSDVGEFYGGLSGKTKENFGVGDSKFITYMNVFSNVIAKPEMCDSVDVGPNERQNLVANGDILFTQSSETPEEVGMASVWLGDFNAYLNSFSFGFRLKDKRRIDSVYLAYLLRSPVYRKKISVQAQGISRYNLSSSRLSLLKIRIHDVEEQRKIAAFLSMVDEKIKCVYEIANKKRELFDNIANKIFAREICFLNCSDKSIEEWKLLSLGDCCSFYAGQTPKSTSLNFYGGNIQWIASGDLNRGVVVKSEKTLTESGLKSANLRILSKGTLVVALFGLEAETVCGNCGLLGVDSAINQACMSITPNDDSLMSEYLFYYYKATGRKYCKRYAQGTKQQNLNVEILSRFEILVPSIDVQKRVCDLLRTFERDIQILVNKASYWRKIRKAFMQQIFV